MSNDGAAGTMRAVGKVPAVTAAAPVPYYKDGDVTLYHGDMLELPIPQVADLFVIDPPYSRAGGLHSGTTDSSQSMVGSDQFWQHWFNAVVRRLVDRMDPRGSGFIFTDYRTVGLVERAFLPLRSGWRVTQCLVWDRDSMGLGSPFRASHELIAFARGPKFKWSGPKDIRNVLRHQWHYGEHEHHPAEKPVSLLSRLIRTAPKGVDALVLDVFAGSASTLIAAKQSGRRAIGVEIEERYCEIAAKRLAQGVLEVPA